MHIYKHNKPLTLECGEKIDGLEIAYHTYGTLNAERNNIIWVCHALTANSDVADWWQNTVVPGGMLDPERYFVVCANVHAMVLQVHSVSILQPICHTTQHFHK